MILDTSLYLSCALDRGRRIATIEKMMDLLGPKRNLFECIVFRGMSGALIAPVLADKLGCSLCMVRKNVEDSHGLLVEGQFEEPFIIVDDFVGSGNTIYQTLQALEKKTRAPRVPVAVAVYNMWPSRRSKTELKQASRFEGTDIDCPLWFADVQEGS